MFEYYGSILGGNDYKAYYDILGCISEHGEYVNVPKMSVDALMNIYTMVKYDHPEIFYIDSMKYSVSESFMRFHPVYSFDKAKTAELAVGLEKRAERILKPALLLDDRKKEKFVHDWIVKNVTYTCLYKNYSHEIYGVLNHGIGVCEGISKTAKYFFDKLEIDSLSVLSEANEKNFAHAWNIVYLFGKPYHLDITFDISAGCQKYYNLPDSVIYKDHRKSVFAVPECI